MPPLRFGPMVACTVLAASALVSATLPARAQESPSGTWQLGDTHVHSDHSSDGSAPRQGSDQRGPGNASVGSQIGFGERAGLDFLPITDHRSYDQHWDPQWTSSRLLLIPGEEANGRPHATVLGHVDQVVDGKEPTGSPGFRHLQQSVWDLDAQDATWTTAHPEDGTVDNGVPTPNASLIGVDRVEVYNSDSPEPKIDYVEDRWNKGFRFGVVGASDSHFTELNAVGGPGTPATRVLADGGSERAILDGLRAGHTTVGRQPGGTEATLLTDLDGNGTPDAVAGDEVAVTEGQTVNLHIRVQRGIGTEVSVYRSPGRTVAPVARYRLTAPDDERVIAVTAPAGESWYRVEVRGPGGVAGIRDPGSMPSPDQALQATTSPVFLTTTGPAVPDPEIALPATTGSDRAVPALADNGRFTGFPDIAATGDTTHVVAERHTPGRTSVLYRRMGAEPAPPIDLAPASASARFPSLAARGQDVWVAWQDERGGQQPRRADVYLRHSIDGGLTWLPEIKVTNGQSRAEHPDLALTPDGKPAVVWMDNRDRAFEVFAQVIGAETVPTDLSRQGKTISDGIPTDSRSPRYPPSLFPSIAVAPDGRLAVGWQDHRFDADPLFTGRTATIDEPEPEGTAPDDVEVLVAARAPGGAWAAPVNVSSAADRNDRHPSLAFAGNVLHVAWDSRQLRASGVNLSLRTARSTDGGATFDVPTPLAEEPEAMSQRPQLSVDPDGLVRAVWYDTRSADWRWKVMTATLDGSAAQQLTGAGNATWPAIDAGRVVFTSDRAAAGQRDVTQQVLLLDVASAGPDPVIPEVPQVPLLLVAAGLLLCFVLRHRRMRERSA